MFGGIVVSAFLMPRSFPLKLFIEIGLGVLISGNVLLFRALKTASFKLQICFSRLTVPTSRLVTRYALWECRARKTSDRKLADKLGGLNRSMQHWLAVLLAGVSKPKVFRGR
jgi:hypothetical protein